MQIHIKLKNIDRNAVLLHASISFYSLKKNRSHNFDRLDWKTLVFVDIASNACLLVPVVTLLTVISLENCFNIKKSLGIQLAFSRFENYRTKDFPTPKNSPDSFNRLLCKWELALVAVQLLLSPTNLNKNLCNVKYVTVKVRKLVNRMFYWEILAFN